MPIKTNKTENNSSTTGGRVWDAGKYMVPFVGTAYSLRDAYYNPTPTNLIDAGLGVLTDAASLTGAGMITKSILGVRRAKRAMNTAQAAYDASRAAAKTAHVEKRYGSGMPRVIGQEKQAQAVETAKQAYEDAADVTPYLAWPSIIGTLGTLRYANADLSK